MKPSQEYAGEQQKKKHHFIPKTYLESFSGQDNRIFFFRKDAPDQLLHMPYENVGHRRYYYSQPTPDGGQDNNRLENLFSEIEGQWSRIVKKIRAREELEPDIESIFQFMALMRVRVPAVRDAIEFLLAEHVRSTLRHLDKKGRLPPLPEELKGKNLYDLIQISIDPHQSIHAMPHLMNGFSIILSMVGFKVLVNRTNIPFITSDNPVLVLDPAQSEASLRPYQLIPGQSPIEIMMPIDPWHVLYGHSDVRDQVNNIPYAEISDGDVISRINRLVAKFSYEEAYLFAKDQAELLKEHSALSPVLDTQALPHPGGEMLISGWKFGKRSKKPKWQPRNEDENHVGD